MNIILIAIGIVTIVLIVVLVRARKNDEAETDPETGEPVKRQADRTHVPPTTCCGAHEVCEAETLLALSDEIYYYDDEELDRFRGTAPDEYDDTAIDEFRDVLLTLQTHEVAGWLRSLALRKVEPPTAIRDEALMIVSEFRDERHAAAEAKAQAEQ